MNCKSNFLFFEAMEIKMPVKDYSNDVNNIPVTV